MSPFFDALEQRHPDEREAALLRALPGQIANAQTRAPAFAGTGEPFAGDVVAMTA